MPYSKKIEKIETTYGIFYSWEGDLITEQLKRYSAHTRNELAMIKSFIREGNNIIDIGAHIGTFSIPFGRFNNGKGKVFSFEANSANYNLLRKNIDENGFENVVLPIHGIVAEKNQFFKMMTPPDSNSGMHYFLPDPNNPSSDVKVINIDKWFEDTDKHVMIHLIKIDVEGAEVSALSSCRKVIKRDLPLLYVEVGVDALGRFRQTVDDVEAILKPLGYHFFRNIGKRNSNDDIFKIVRLKKLKEGGNFFDFLAIHPSSDRYPSKQIGNFRYKCWKAKISAKKLINNIYPNKK